MAGVTDWSVRNWTPPSVETMLPFGIVFVREVSRLWNVTRPVARVRSTRTPVDSNVSCADTSTEMRSAGTTPASGSGSLAAVSATTDRVCGPTRCSRGVTTTEADGNRT